MLKNLKEKTGIVIGDEGCIYVALSDEWDAIQAYANANNLKVRYETPLTGEKYMQKMYDKIVSLSEAGPIKVSFNDYGLLHKCKKIIEEHRIEAVLGRILTRSFIDCPWAEKLLQHEDKSVSEAILGFSFSHEQKMALIEEFHINELEINIPKIAHYEMVLPDVNLTAYYSNSIISVGRVCFQARYLNYPIENCVARRICDNPLEIELAKRWINNSVGYYDDNNEMQKDIGEMYLQGNIVYRKVNDSEFSKMESSLSSCIYGEI